MKRLKTSKKERALAKLLIITISKTMQKQGLKIKDSNVYHFITYSVNRKMNLGLTTGWFKHGPYVLAVDDALIDMGVMDKKQHQLYGKEQAEKVWMERVK